MCIERYLVYDIDFSRSRDVISHDTPFDTPYAISYRSCVVTEDVSPGVFELISPKHFGGHDLDLSMSREVIDHVTNRFPIGTFLFVVY